MPASVSVRDCRPDDLPAVHQLQTAWATEQITYGYEAESLDALTRRIGPFFLVAVHEQAAVVGFVCGTIRTSDGLAVVPAGQRYLDVDDLFVTPPFRDQGIGGELLEALLDKARAAGVGRCLVYSATKDARRILDFYEGHGFSSWFVQMFREL